MKLNIALVGCDTSHVVHFSRLLNAENEPGHVAGARVIGAVADGYGSIPGSRQKAVQHAAEIEASYGVELFESIGELPACDAIFLQCTDGSRHLEQLREALTFRVPVFVDKPLALSTREAEEMFDLAAAAGVPLMSSSALRYDAHFTAAVAETNGAVITGADIYGCTELLQGCPGFFWYGIHSAEMLFAAMGAGFCDVRLIHEDDYDLITAIWEDGRIGTIRGSRRPHFAFGGTLHTSEAPIAFTVPEDVLFYRPLLQNVISFIRTGVSPVPRQETLDIVRFLESATALLDETPWRNEAGEPALNGSLAR